MNLVDILRGQHLDTIMQDLAAMPHRTSIMPLEKMEAIGLILPPMTDKDKITLSQFNTMLKKKEIKLRFIEQPTPLEEYVDKNGLPKEDIIKSFIQYHYDMLIDATTGDNLFGPYVTLKASSRLRVGYNSNSTPLQEDSDNPMADIPAGKRNKEIYDLLIIGKNPFDLSKYLLDILGYIVDIRKVVNPT